MNGLSNLHTISHLHLFEHDCLILSHRAFLYFFQRQLLIFTSFSKKKMLVFFFVFHFIQINAMCEWQTMYACTKDDQDPPKITFFHQIFYCFVILCRYPLPIFKMCRYKCKYNVFLYVAGICSCNNSCYCGWFDIIT